MKYVSVSCSQSKKKQDDKAYEEILKELSDIDKVSSTSYNKYITYTVLLVCYKKFGDERNEKIMAEANQVLYKYKNTLEWKIVRVVGE